MAPRAVGSDQKHVECTSAGNACACASVVCPLSATMSEAVACMWFPLLRFATSAEKHWVGYVRMLPSLACRYLKRSPCPRGVAFAVGVLAQMADVVGVSDFADRRDSFGEPKP
jgi:hypothetical protein